jgi:hypothetical protein
MKPSPNELSYVLEGSSASKVMGEPPRQNVAASRPDGVLTSSIARSMPVQNKLREPPRTRMWLRSRATPEADKLLPMDPKGVSEIATPAQYRWKTSCKSLSSVSSLTEIRRAPLTSRKNSSQNQLLERDRSRHPSSLRHSPTSRPVDALHIGRSVGIGSAHLLLHTRLGRFDPRLLDALLGAQIDDFGNVQPAEFYHGTVLFTPVAGPTSA